MRTPTCRNTGVETLGSGARDMAEAMGIGLPSGSTAPGGVGSRAASGGIFGAIANATLGLLENINTVLSKIEPEDVEEKRTKETKKERRKKRKEEKKRRRNSDYENENDPQKKHITGDNTRQNSAFRGAVKEIERAIDRKLKKPEKRRLHEEITGRGLDYREIVEVGKGIFN